MKIVPILIGSQSDLSFAQRIQEQLRNYQVSGIIRISSAHKSANHLLGIVEKYDSQVDLFITVAGKSNALSSVVDGASSKPVIACPPLSHETMYDIFSSISMPRGIAPLVVLAPENAALAAAKIIALTDQTVAKMVRMQQLKKRCLLSYQDIQLSSQTWIPAIQSSLSQRWQETAIISDQKPNCWRLYKGKVRDCYISDERELQLLVATDRVSSFDRHIGLVPFKGAVLSLISQWWFNQTSHIIANHLLGTFGGRISLVQQCEVFPIEFVVRGFITGNTETSLWTHYQRGKRSYCGHLFEDGLVKNQELPHPVVTPTTKDSSPGGHDELISEEEIIERRIMTQEEWDFCHAKALELYRFGYQLAMRRGLLLVDTKYEFGLLSRDDGKQEIVLVDEIHTPDSSRYWLLHSYQDRFQSGEDPEIVDKDLIRKWVKNNTDNPYDLAHPVPDIPKEHQITVSQRYLELYYLITGEEFPFSNMALMEEGSINLDQNTIHLLRRPVGTALEHLQNIIKERITIDGF